MKRLRILLRSYRATKNKKLTFLFLLVISVFQQLYAEGFAAGTIIKVPDGYTKIEDLHIGNYGEVKGHPCGNTRNQPVFFNGKNYISPDIDGHNGGMWKVFDRRGNILHTASRRFEKIVKIYKK